MDGDRVGIALRLVTPVEEGFEERDTAVVLQDETGEFGAPMEIHDDRYVLDLGGCPASGPEVVSAGGRLHAAWWSGAEGRAPGWWYASGSSDGEFGEPVSLPGELDLTYSVELTVGEDEAAWAAGLSWGDDMPMEEGHDHDHDHGSDGASDEPRPFEVLLWRVGTDGKVTVVEGSPTVDRTTQGYDLATIGSTPLIAWIEGGGAKVATIEPVGAGA